MKAPNKIYVEVCEDGIFAFPEPPFKESVEYIRTDLVEGIKGNSEEIPSNVDLGNTIRIEFGIRAKVEDGRRCVKLNWDKFSVLARHFYELGLKARKEK